MINVDEADAHAPAFTFRTGVLARTNEPRIDVVRRNENLPPAFDLVLAIRRLPRQSTTLRPARHAPIGDFICPARSLLEDLRKVNRVRNL